VRACVRACVRVCVSFSVTMKISVIVIFQPKIKLLNLKKIKFSGHF